MLIALQGKKGHGKTTIASHLVAQHGFVRVRFAGPLKDLLCPPLFGMTSAQTDGFLKEAPCVDVSVADPEELARATVELLGSEDSPELLGRWTRVYAPLLGACRLYSPREVMQVVGGGARTNLSPEIWIDLWRAQYRGSGAPRVVVDDLRYPNEKRAIEQEGGEVWRSVRTDLPDPGDLDPSETACDGLPDDAFAAVLRRTTGVPELLAEVDRLMAPRLAARAS